MALTSNKGFFPVRNISGPDTPSAFEFILDANEQITIGDAVDLNAGYLQAVDAGDRVLGVVVGIVDNNGLPVFITGADIDGTIAGDDTYTAASDNTTDKKVKAQVILSDAVVYRNVADSTLTAAEIGTYFDTTATGDQVTGTGSIMAQFMLLKIDPDDATVGYFKIAESQTRD